MVEPKVVPLLSTFSLVNNLTPGEIRFKLFLAPRAFIESESQVARVNNLPTFNHASKLECAALDRY